MADAFPVVVIGGSSGALEALTRIVRVLPPKYPAVLCVAVHMPRTLPSYLPQILSRSGALPAEHGKMHEVMVPGRIYVAPPDHHLLIEGGEVMLSREASENGRRPSIDVLFRSAARALRDRVAGVVLSGALDDGTAGLRDIKRFDGIAIAQDPEDAMTPSMPQNAIAHVPVDYVLNADDIGQILRDLGQGPVSAYRKKRPHLGPPIIDERREGLPSGLSCPTCGGSLFQRDDEELMRFRCHVGHAFSEVSLDEDQARVAEEALWSAVRALEERAILSRRFAERARKRGRSHVAEMYELRAEIDSRRARVAREALALEPLDDVAQAAAEKAAPK